MRSRKKAACQSCCLVSGLLFIVIPVLLFLISAVFGAMLYGIECYEFNKFLANPDSTFEVSSGTLNALESEVCSYWNWILYVCGNLVGLATPLTNVTPPAGHIFAKIVDLVIAMWSVSIVGIVLGIILGLATLQTATTKINDVLESIWTSATNQTAQVSNVAITADTRLAQTPEGDASHSKEAITMRQLSQQIEDLTAAFGQQQRSLNELKVSLSSLFVDKAVVGRQDSLKTKVRRRRSQGSQSAKSTYGNDETHFTAVGDVR